ncbi:tyrosine--tRNA ligase [Glycomyces tritici]|uniref:Tyrosine--tRNA ligase n=1 Tax=Glycomyces tritici TaxID=2665176 RepID=A0ABT7YRV2_9ACTN|nr:tyrosine--tRNA ligase [Glycomyces tritici]MDN3241364.1 tyrosine--tRNA ligase [Glycomyces tritici]MDN3242152.1 tyrosine--tRNA ligase [Glycomyces tritici]
MHILDDFAWRGLIQDSTGIDALREHIDAGQVTFYVGFDPTAVSLHVGHLMQVITARRLQQAGLRPLLLVGGATGQIGDPKEAGERSINPPEVVAGWVEKIRGQLAPFVTYDGENGAIPVNNLDWTSEMGVVEFLRDVGKHFPVSKMLAREVVKARLESGISFTEFSYQLLQSNDFYELHRRHGCSLQFGGSDQWGNITAGVDFVRRKAAEHVHAFVTPLVLKADGTKFGKTEGGAVWLDPELTSPYAFYQFWVNSADADVVGYLKYFSFKSHEEIEELERATAEKPAARLAQKALAEEMTSLLHGAEETAHVVAASQALFGRGELAELPESTLRAALVEAGLAEFTKPGVTVAEAMKESGVVASLGEARRAAKEGGAYLNNVRVSDPAAVIDPSDLLHGRYGVIRRGKKTVAGFEVVG